MGTPASTTPLLDRIRRGTPRPPQAPAIVERHAAKPVSPFVRLARAGQLPSAALTTEVGR